MPHLEFQAKEDLQNVMAVRNHPLPLNSADLPLPEIPNMFLGWVPYCLVITKIAKGIGKRPRTVCSVVPTRFNRHHTHTPKWGLGFQSQGRSLGKELSIPKSNSTIQALMVLNGTTDFFLKIKRGIGVKICLLIPAAGEQKQERA